MFWQNTHVVLFGVASAAAAHLPPKPADAVRDIAPRQTDSTLSQLLDFANDLGLTACIPQALPLAAELPTIPSGLLNNDLFSQALSQTTLALSDVCQFSITGSDGPKFTSFLPEVYSWYDEHSSQVASIVSGCPSASPLVQTVEAYGACSQVTGGAQLPASITSPGDLSSSGSDALSIQTDTETFSIETDTVISDSTLSITEPTASATTESDTMSSSGSASATETTTESSSSSSVSQAQAPRETGFVMAAAAMAGFIGAVAAM